MAMTLVFALTLSVIAANATAAPPAKPDAPPAATMSTAECEVWARELSFSQSLADHDPAAFAAHLHEAAVFGAESPQPTRGRAAIVSRWTGLIQGEQLRLSWYPRRTTIGGIDTVASSSGPALYEDLRPGADPRYSIGGFHTVWHKGTDGVWRVLFDDGIEPKPATEAEVAAFRSGRQTQCPQA